MYIGLSGLEKLLKFNFAKYELQPKLVTLKHTRMTNYTEFWIIKQLDKPYWLRI